MNGGVSWQALLHPVAGGVSGIDFWSPSAGLVSVGSQSLFITSDGGTSWRPLRLPPGWIVSDAFIGGDEPTGICFTDKGVWMGGGEPRSPFRRLRQHKRWSQLEARAVICGPATWSRTRQARRRGLDRRVRWRRRPGFSSRKLQGRWTCRAYLPPSTFCAALTSAGPGWTFCARRARYK